MVVYSEAGLEAIGGYKDDIERTAFDLFRSGRLSESLGVRDRRFRAWFGCSSEVASELWYLLRESGSLSSKRGATMDRFLWALWMLKAYPIEEEGASRVGGVDEGTFSE